MGKRTKLQLTNEELNNINNHDSWMEKRKLELTIEELKAEIIRLNYSAQLSKVNTVKKSIDEKRKTQETFMLEIANTLSIKGRWGFDSQSGEIILAEKQEGKQ